MSRYFWRQIFAHGFYLIYIIFEYYLLTRSKDDIKKVMVTFLVQLLAWPLTVSRKTDSITDAFLWNFWSLQNIIFAFVEDYWATVSDNQQHFERIASFISKKLVQSQLIVWGFQNQLLATIHSICSENVYR